MADKHLACRIHAGDGLNGFGGTGQKCKKAPEDAAFAYAWLFLRKLGRAKALATLYPNLGNQNIKMLRYSTEYRGFHFNA